MAKKVTAIVLSVVLVVAAACGAYFYFSNSSDKDKDIDNKTETTDVISTEIYLDEDAGAQEYIVDTTDSNTDETQYSDDFIPSDKNVSDNTMDVITTSFTVERIVDHTTNEVVSGRVVFGKSFNPDENYIKFDSLGNFEISLNGYLGRATKGTYTEYDDIIYVEFEDGRAAEYQVAYTDNGIISYIVVNYGDYDVYFS